MAVNLAAIRDYEEGRASKTDYRHYKQPLELKNINELQIMTENEKEMYLQKLKTEICEYENREATYEAKRTELLEMEHAFRQVNNRQGDRKNQDHGRARTQDVIESGLKDQIADFDRKDRLLRGARRDLGEKMHQIQDTLRKRDDEMEELRRVLQGKAKQGDQLAGQLEQLKDEQVKLLQWFEGEKEGLYGHRDGKEQRQGEVDAFADQVRQLRGQLQLCERKQREGNQTLQEKDRELKDLDDEVR